MKNADEIGHKVSSFVQFMKEPEDDIAYSLKKAVKEEERA